MSLEKDITSLKKIMEADNVFKAAGPDELKKRGWHRDVDSMLKVNTIQNRDYSISGPHWIGRSENHHDSYARKTEGAQWAVYIMQRDHDFDTTMKNLDRRLAACVRKYFKTEAEATQYMSTDAFERDLPTLVEAEQVFKAAGPDELAQRRVEYPETTHFHGGRVYGPGSNRGFISNWINGVRNTARPRNMRSEGDVLYSYRTPIAIKKEGLIYSVDRRFSVTTSKQQYYVRTQAGDRLRLVPQDEFKALAREAGANYMGWLGESVSEAKPIFRAAGPEDIAKRKEDRIKAIGAHADANSGEWFEIARAELSRELAVAIELVDDGGLYGPATMQAVDGEGSNGEREWAVYRDSDNAEQAAIARVTEDMNDDPPMFTESFIQQYISIRPTDRRMIAQEESDNYVDEVLRDADVLEEAGVTDEYEELQAKIDSTRSEARKIALEKTQEDMLESAKETVREKKYDEIHAALEDPIQYFVHDHGIYSIQDLMKASFIYIDTDEAAKDAVDTDGVAHFLDNYDGSEVDLPSGAVAFGTN